MISLEKIKEKYSKFSDDELLKTVNDINSLRKDVIPILQNELKKRNLIDGLEKINNYLLKEVVKKSNDNFDTKRFIDEQLKQGNSLEAIKHKLNHMDTEINMFDVIKEQVKDEKFIKQYIKTNKKKGKRIVKIANELKEKFNIPVEKTKAYNEILKKEAQKYKFIGLGLIIFSGISILLRGSIGVSSIVIIILGFWYISEASKK